MPGRQGFLVATGLLAFVLFGRTEADFIDDWAALPENRAEAKCQVEHFKTPWPGRIDLGTSGFLMVATAGFGGNETFEMHPSGECSFLFQDISPPKPPAIWRRASFKISKKEMHDLISSIEKAKVKNLEKSYSDNDVNDGCQAFLSVSDGKQMHSVWMNNWFPQEFRTILPQVALLLKAQHLQLSDAPTSSMQAGVDLYHEAFPEERRPVSVLK